MSPPSTSLSVVKMPIASMVPVVGNGRLKFASGGCLGPAPAGSPPLTTPSAQSEPAMLNVSVASGTIPHEVTSSFDGALVLLKPASEGTGVIAGKTVRAVLDAAGVRNVLSKSLGSSNAINVARATINGLASLQRPDEVAARRGLPADEFVPKGVLKAYNERKKQIAAGETH